MEMEDYKIAILKEKADIINGALKIINELALNSYADVDFGDEDIALQNLIIKARELKKDRWFKFLIK